MSAIRSSRRGAMAAQKVVVGGGTTSLNYSFSSGRPGGMVDVQTTAANGTTPTVIINGTTLREGSLLSGSGGYNLHSVMPDVMSITNSIAVSVTVGALDSAANNRAVGPGVFSADGSKGVYLRFASASSTASLITWNGTAETTQKTSTQTANSGTVIWLTGTLSAGTWSWTVKLNAGSDIAALTWADSGHVVDLPGYQPGIAFRTQRSGSNFYSRGVTTITAAST